MNEDDIYFAEMTAANKRKEMERIGNDPTELRPFLIELHAEAYKNAVAALEAMKASMTVEQFENGGKALYEDLEGTLKQEFSKLVQDRVPDSGMQENIMSQFDALASELAEVDLDVPGDKTQGAPANEQDEDNTIRRASVPEENNTIRRASGSSKPAVGETPKPSPNTLLGGRFVKGEDNIYRRVGETRDALADEGDSIRFIDKQIDAFQAGVELAKSKGWDAIEITGTDVFRSEAWFYAHTAGLQVIGYTPNANDLERFAVSQQEVTKSSPEYLNSQSEAEEWALRSNFGVKSLNSENGRYAGNIVKETDHHIIQDTGKQVAVIHSKADLKQMPDNLLEAASLKIQYSKGRGSLAVEPSREKANVR